MGQAWLARDPVSRTWSDFNGRSSRVVGPVLLLRSRNQIFPFPSYERGYNTAPFSSRLARDRSLTEPEHFDNLRNCLEPKDFLKRARSLMVVVSTPPTQNYEEFTKKVREYSSKEPFNFVIPELLRKYEKVTFFISNVRSSSNIDSLSYNYAMRAIKSVGSMPKNTESRFTSNYLNAKYWNVNYYYASLRNIYFIIIPKYLKLKLENQALLEIQFVFVKS